MLEKKKLKEIAKNLTAEKLDFMSAFRRNLYMYADDEDITLSDIAEASDLSLSTVKTVVYGNSKNVNLSTAVNLAKGLGVSLDELVGADTIPELSRESLRMCREMPENDLMLVRWFIRCLHDLNNRTEPNKRYITVMLPEKDNDGNYKLVSRFEKVEITGLEEPLRSKVYIGFKMFSDYYMPYYFPNDILLIANDRPAKSTENVLVRAGDYVFLVKRVVENGIAKYYSIRDGKYRIDESEVDELIGYVAYVKRDNVQYKG